MAYHYPVIYWNTANLISDSGGEDGNTNYGKIAIAISHMQQEGIKVVLPDINRVGYDFTPDEKSNEIVFGLKGLQGVGDKIAKAIISHKPYTSMMDFYDKMQEYKKELPENKFGDTSMISLIKAGSFDTLEQKNRVRIMKEFIRNISSPLTSLKISNIEDLNSLGLLTEEQKKYELRLFKFRKYVYNKKFYVGKKGKSANTEFYKLDHKFAEPFFLQYFEPNMTEHTDYEYTEDGEYCVKRGSLDREFNKCMENFKEEVLSNPEMLQAVNTNKLREIWEEKNLNTSVSKWEMDSLSYYYGEHELAHVKRKEYNIVNFNDLSPEGKVANWYYYRGQKKPRFELFRICGTILDKNKTKATVALLTPDGVVNVKFYKGQFAFYDKQISEIDEDSDKKTVLEKSWFGRGTKLLVTGYRREEQFIPKQYSDSVYKHSLQLITGIEDDGTLNLVSERAGNEDE